MNKSVIYYTDNNISDPIMSVVRGYIQDSGLSIVSTSLAPIQFGKNIVVPGEPGYTSMVKQILTALENSEGKYVFFCEHDVLYPKSHFTFTPPRDDIYYYNDNVYRWYFGSPIAIAYDRLFSLSSLCVNRRLVMDNYRLRMRLIEKYKDKITGKEPNIVRAWGYEPGAKKKKRGGITDDDFETWKSDETIIDIRHKNTFSPPKVTLDSFKHQPKNWREIPIEDIKGWNLKEMFAL